MISVDIDQIDTALEADGALAGMLWAFGTKQGMDPGLTWTKVFPGSSTPVWMWIRGDDDPQVRIEAEWGVFRLEAEVELGPNGLFITVGASVSESPVVVQVSKKVWVDFGRGEIPGEVPGASVVNAVDLARPSTATGVFMDLFSANVATRFEQSRRPEMAGLTRRTPGRVASFFNAFVRSKPTPVSGPWPLSAEGVDAGDRQRYTRLRRARGLSLADTAHRLATTTDIKVGKDTLRRFENDEGKPHDRLLPAALDYVLGANGHLAVVEIRSGNGSGTVTFPSFWHAPVWLAFDGQTTGSSLELHWGVWWRRIEGPLPTLLIAHYAEPLSPLRIVAETSVRWSAGVGCRTMAVPINHDWIPTSVDAATRAMAETEDAVLDAIRRSGEQNDESCELGDDNSA